MSSALPEKRHINNFDESDQEGKWLFNTSANTLIGLFSDNMLQKMEPAFTDLPAMHGTESLEMEIQATLSKLHDYHQWMTTLIGKSRQHGDAVPIMSFFEDIISHREKKGGYMADGYTKWLRQENIRGRTYKAEDVSKHAFKALLLDVSKLHVLLEEEGAFSALQDLAQRPYQTAMGSSTFGHMLKSTMIHEEEFEDLRITVSEALQKMQRALGVEISEEEQREAVLHPLDAPLAISTLDRIRQDHFHAQGYSNSFVEKLSGQKHNSTREGP